MEEFVFQQVPTKLGIAAARDHNGLMTHAIAGRTDETPCENTSPELYKYAFP